MDEFPMPMPMPMRMDFFRSGVMGNGIFERNIRVYLWQEMFQKTGFKICKYHFVFDP
jgi:hypothetical protein